ncbi:hypothetical protein PR048_011469 [Dryococelus australis]|uniref:Uncharacterized protein n=1 Tax=Dryococelus australis TaxID=614101 RepID=A0ABQ9HLP4_9NEOP|nr:hypothetical protein PR048_011469 [Dryococelus australis]
MRVKIFASFVIKRLTELEDACSIYFSENWNQQLKNRSFAGIAQIKIKAHFVSNHCKPVEEKITLLGGSTYPTAHILSCKLEDLETKLQLLSVGEVGWFSPSIASLLGELSAAKKAEDVASLKAVTLKAS